jgi:hypothetical protein
MIYLMGALFAASLIKHGVFNTIAYTVLSVVVLFSVVFH